MLNMMCGFYYAICIVYSWIISHICRKETAVSYQSCYFVCRGKYNTDKCSYKVTQTITIKQRWNVCLLQSSPWYNEKSYDINQCISLDINNLFNEVSQRSRMWLLWPIHMCACMFVNDNNENLWWVTAMTNIGLSICLFSRIYNEWCFVFFNFNSILIHDIHSVQD